jgi:uncharacterized protein with PIN domain
VDAKFVIDTNVGRLARWLRMMGYDALLFHELDDGLMVKLALAQGRIIVTKDTEFMKRRAVTSHRVRAVLVSGDSPELQMQKVIEELKLDTHFKPFTRCLECNTVLLPRDRNDLEGAVPPRVYEKQYQYMECPLCRRLYWQGTHWEDMRRKLHEFGSPRPQVAEGDKR